MKNNTKKKKIVVASAIAAILIAAIMVLNIVLPYLVVGARNVGKIVDVTNGKEQTETETQIGEAVKVEDVVISNTSGAKEEGGHYEAYFNEKVILYEDEQLDDIYDSIYSLVTHGDGVYMEMLDDNTAAADLGVGDICVFEDTGKSPFGETYYAKIAEVKELNGHTTYVIENPTFDEVFDIFNMDIDAALNGGNLEDVHLMEGVNLEFATSIEDYVAEQENSSHVEVASNGDLTLSGLSDLKDGIDINIRDESYTDGDNDSSDKKFDAFIVEFEIDVLKALGIGKDDNSDDDDDVKEYAPNEATIISVYRQDYKNPDGTVEYGTKYHNKDCRLLLVGDQYQDKTVVEKVSLYDEHLAGSAPCTLCKAPKVSGEGVVEFEKGITLSGKAGIQHLNFDGDLKYNLFSKPMIPEAWAQVSGEIIAGVEFGANAELSIGAGTTEVTLPGGWAKIEGLDEKLFPLGYLQFDLTLLSVTNAGVLTQGNKTLRRATGSSAASVIVLVYVDINGSITLDAKVNFEYSRKFNYRVDLFKDGELQKNPGKELENDPGYYKLTVEAGVEVDFDAHVGVSVMLYLSNVNIAEVVIAQVGVEGEGSAGVEVEFEWGDKPDNVDFTVGDENTDDESSSNDEQTDQGSDMEGLTLEQAFEKLKKIIAENFEYEYEGRVYLKAFAFNLRISVHVELFDVYEKDFGLSVETDPIVDFTIVEWEGTNKPDESVIEYDKNVHIYKAGYAEDEEYVYFVGKDNQVRKKKKGNDSVETTLTEAIHFICGIDDEYLYVVDENDNTGQKCLYRVNKETGVSKILAKGVNMVYDLDDQYLYYTTTFDKTNLKRVGKESGDMEDFVDMSNDVTYAAVWGDDLYVATTAFALIGKAYRIYRVVGEGNKQEVIDISFQEGQRGVAALYANYATLTLPVDRTLISASLAGEWYQFGNTSEWIMIPDIEHILYSGDDGFAVIETYTAEESGEEKFRLVYYKGATGGKTVIKSGLTQEERPTALSKDNNGNWYFLMLDKEGVPSIYTMDSNFGNIRKVQSLNTNERNINIKSCSSYISDRTVYFYEEVDGIIYGVYRYTY